MTDVESLKNVSRMLQEYSKNVQECSGMFKECSKEFSKFYSSAKSEPRN